MPSSNDDLIKALQSNPGLADLLKALSSNPALANQLSGISKSKQEQGPTVDKLYQSVSVCVICGKEILAQGRGQFNSTQDFKDANGAIDTHMRMSLNDNVFDDYLNPAVWVGSMANKLGAAPDNINRGNYGQAAMAFAEPLAFGAGEKVVGPIINKYIKSKRVLPIIGDYKVPTIAESWGKYKPVVLETEQGLEPYISKIGEPSISREEEVVACCYCVFIL